MRRDNIQAPVRRSVRLGLTARHSTRTNPEQNERSPNDFSMSSIAERALAQRSQNQG